MDTTTPHPTPNSISCDADDQLPHEAFMHMALAEAEAAFAENEVPVGAVIRRGGRVIAACTISANTWRSHRPCRNDRHHASGRVARRLAVGRLHAVRDPRAVPDVAVAIVLARVATVVYGAIDPKAGAVQTLYRSLPTPG